MNNALRTLPVFLVVPLLQLRPASLSDIKAAVEVLVDESYSAPPPFDMRKGDYALDGGANVGAFLEWARINKAAAVDCYEPLPSTFVNLGEVRGELWRGHGLCCRDRRRRRR